MDGPALPAGLRIESSAACGRRVVAARPFAAGDVALANAPWATLLLPRHAARRCAACHRDLESAGDGGTSGAAAKMRCGRCKRAYFCGPACQKRSWPDHRHECGAASAADESDAVDVLLARRVARRLLAAEAAGAPPPRAAAAATAADVRAMVAWDERAHDAQDAAQDGDALVRSLVAAGRRANFCVADDLLHAVSAACCPLGALLNHSCDPNTVVAWTVDGGADVQHFIVTRSIAVGEELTHSYVDCGAPTAQRTAALARYGFSCVCKRCTAPWRDRDAKLEGSADLSTIADAEALRRNAELRARATAADGADELRLLDDALKCLGLVAPTHLALLETREALLHALLASSDFSGAADAAHAVAAAREAVYETRYHPRVALDWLTLHELAEVAGLEALRKLARVNAIDALRHTTPSGSTLLQHLLAKPA
ncbi:hypothetical protein M885DRAFT_510870 [Pelagophyceae sp. CCMP2097]|nr:hypothetical protein M885DRAFT_510870 [Pelagophyceae sp. CCMP2097]